MTKTLRALLFALSLGALPAVALAQTFSDDQKKEIGDITRQYLLDNPEVLLEVSKALEDKQQTEEDAKREGALSELAKDIFHYEGDFVAGNPDGDVTMVEFFDYNCGWCKKGLPEVQAMLEEDKNLRFVLKEFPIFGGDSDYAAMAAIASKKQGKYWEFHVAMLGHEGKVTRETVIEIATGLGIDIAKLKADMDSTEVSAVLRKNQELAQALAINGTPGFVIDKKVIPGYLPKEGLMAAVAEVRESGGCQIC